MNNRELDKILTAAKVPERPPEFWNEFPRRVTARLRSADAPVRAQAPAEARRSTSVPGQTLISTWLWRGAFATGLALVFLYIGFNLGIRHQPTAEEQQLAIAQKYLREVQALFPNQIEAIEFDASGTHLKLAEHADVPSSPALYVSVCGPHGCRRFVTFSGQQIRVNGDILDVLLDRQGAVLVVGKQWAWPDPNRANAGPYRVEAKPLPVNS